MEFLPIKRALLSVTDKSSLTDLAKMLVEKDVELISTGGTLKALEQAGFKVTPVSDITGFPEILGGRVKTLHPHIHGGILADKDNPEHLKTLEEFKIKPIDLVCVNLYNFASAVDKQLSLKDAIEEIDIGGPCMLRATAKNFHSMTVLPEIAAYGEFMEEFKANDGKISLGFRQKMAARTFALTSDYDKMITGYLQ